MSSRNARPRWCAPVALSLMVLLSGAGCGGGGGGSGGSLSLLSAHLENGSRLPAQGVFLNDQVVLEFSSPLDPASVHFDAIQIRKSEGGFAIPAPGTLVTIGSTVRFVPRLPHRPDLADSGLEPASSYRIRILSHPDARAVRSRGGQRLESSLDLTFSTRSTEPFFLDAEPGAPELVAVAIDRDGDGRLDTDGDPATVDSEELLVADGIPLLDGVPVGLARSPLRIGLLLSEAIHPGSLALDGNRDGVADAARLRVIPGDRPVAFDLELTQGVSLVTGRLFSLVEIVPRSTLPPASLLRLELEEIVVDLSPRPLPVQGASFDFVTETGPSSFEDRFEETFGDRRRHDPSSTAEWDILDSGVLTAGKGVGGTGLDGPFRPAPDAHLVFDTDVRDVYNFTEIFIPRATVVEVVGHRPLQLFSTGDIEIAGAIMANGEPGEGGRSLASDPLPVGGGKGGPGGGRGGRGNVLVGGGRAESGVGPPGTLGGGQGGRRSEMIPGGGGGGGHERPGGSDPDGAVTGGAGGKVYGDPLISLLFGGSGGGAGGNGQGRVQGSDTSGGGGGGGGGAILLSTGATFRLDGGRVATNGGRGGDGGFPTSLARGGGGGGGGSGGSVKIEAFRSAEILVGGLRSFGGEGGASGGPGARSGSAGAPGRLRMLVLSSDAEGSNLGKSFALSRFLDTGADTPRYAFVANDPVTGEVPRSGRFPDLAFQGPIPDTATVHVFFQGARVLDEASLSPDPASLTAWTPRIEDVDGHRFVRYRIEFDIGQEILTVPRPVVTRLTVRFSFDI